MSVTRLLMELPTALYRLYDATGRLLYVGIAVNPEVRWRAHARRKSWWPEVAIKNVQWYPDRPSASAAETIAIDAENPLYNESRAPAVRPAGAKPRNKISIYLSDDIAARAKATGLTGAELIRIGLDPPELEPLDVMLRRVVREELGVGSRH